MKNLEAIKERYLNDQLPIRLGGLAANLARVESFSTNDAHLEVVESLLNESKYFIEWTAMEAGLHLQAELIELQRLLSRWQYSLNDIWPDLDRRDSFSRQAGAWSRRVLESSGLLG